MLPIAEQSSGQGKPALAAGLLSSLFSLLFKLLLGCQGGRRQVCSMIYSLMDVCGEDWRKQGEKLTAWVGCLLAGIGFETTNCP